MIMTILATIKPNLYVVKWGCEDQIQSRKASQSTLSAIKYNAELFRKNNLKTMR